MPKRDAMRSFGPYTLTNSRSSMQFNASIATDVAAVALRYPKENPAWPLPGTTGFPAPSRVAMSRAGAAVDDTATNASGPAAKENPANQSD
jgi:hypothetical protein